MEMSLSDLTNKNILISGASAAGPTLAYWLSRHGFNPTVVERHPTVRPGGYAIDVRGTAIQVASKMGILDAIRAADTKLEQVLFVDEAGEVQATMDPNFGAGEGLAGDVELLRDDLSTILYNLTKDNVEYMFNNSIRGLNETDDGVEVEFDSGDVRKFDLVIGADGAHSNVRSLAFGEEAQFSHFLGRYIGVFTIPNYLNLDRKWLWHFRPNKIVGIMQYGLSQHTRALLMCNWPRQQFAPSDTAKQKSIVREILADDMVWEIPRLLEEMDKSTDFYFDEISQIRMPSWSKGRVALCGDAAAAPTPITGQGTSTAMIEAYVLAGELAAARGDYHVAFARYEQEAREFAELNQKLAFTIKEMQTPTSWEEVHGQLAMLNSLKEADASQMGEGSMVDMVQTAANAINIKDY